MGRLYGEGATRLNPVGSAHQVIHKRKPFALGAVLEQVWKRQKPPILMGESPPMARLVALLSMRTPEHASPRGPRLRSQPDHSTGRIELI